MRNVFSIVTGLPLAAEPEPERVGNTQHYPFEYLDIDTSWRSVGDGTSLPSILARRIA